MNHLNTEIGYYSLNKYGEQLCGDQIQVVWPGEDSVVVVLADGLGSGVKASILSTLTSKIIGTMMAHSMSLEDCVSTIAETLPVCGERGIAYSTFTIARVSASREAELIQYDNPHSILLHGGKRQDYPETSLVIDGKTIYQSRFPLLLGDTLVLISDGVLHAGTEKRLNYDWQRDDVADFLETMADPTMSAKTLTSILLEECSRLYGGKPSDDTTVCTIRIRERNQVNLLIGPPASPDNVSKMMSLFFSKEGGHIVCGGTTSSLAAEFLGKTLIPAAPDPESEIPPISSVEGVDLVTEGAITIERVLLYAQNYLGDNRKHEEWGYAKDGASRIARMLFEEATDINFFVGRASNPAHQDPNLPLGFSKKMHLVETLASCLQQMGKKIKVSYF